jgi:imidazolonepropionase-like amidohydrolase
MVEADDRAYNRTVALHLLAILLSAGCAAWGQASLVFDHVDVFDGYRMLRDQRVAVRDGMIVEVAAASGGAQRDSQAINGRGKTLLPGLIDAHVHIGDERSLEEAAALGITTELDMYASDMPGLMKIRAGNYPNAADFRTSGFGVTAPKGHPTELAPELKLPTLAPGDDAQAFVDARIAEGSDYIKIIYEHRLPTLTHQQLAAVVRAAHRRRKLAISHISTQAEASDAIEAGVDGIAHIFMDSAPRADFAATAASHHIFAIGTLSVLQSFSGAPSGPDLAADPRLGPYLFGPGWSTSHIRVPAKGPNLFPNALAAMRQLHAAGVPILAGTDSPNPGTAWGLSLHNELNLLVGCGFTPSEALRAATAEPARQFFLIDRGGIEVGRRADLLLVDGDPSKDIEATRAIEGVWEAGVAIDRAAVRREAAKSR